MTVNRRRLRHSSKFCSGNAPKRRHCCQFRVRPDGAADDDLSDQQRFYGDHQRRRCERLRRRAPGQSSYIGYGSIHPRIGPNFST